MLVETVFGKSNAQLSCRKITRDSMVTEKTAFLTKKQLMYYIKSC